MSNELKITKFKLERISQAIKQVDLSRMTGIPGVYLSKYESGRHIPSREDQRKIAEALNVPIKKIFPPDEKKYA
jgi:transcriptional regulator with XRE-family HTH domain